MSTYSNWLQPALQNLLRVVQFFHQRSSCTTHISADVQRITLNASCMTISSERTEQLDIFCRVTVFTSDFLSFIDVEFIRFFHGALQLQWMQLHCNVQLQCNVFVWQSHGRLKTARTWSGLSFSAPESLGNVCCMHSQPAFQLMYWAWVFCVTLLLHPCGIVAYNILCLNLPWPRWLGVRKGWKKILLQQAAESFPRHMCGRLYVTRGDCSEIVQLNK